MSTRFPLTGLYNSATHNGMVLLLCLIFLTALALLGLSASADTILQNKLAANLQETERAKQSALAALTWAENWLFEMNGPAPESCAVPCEDIKIHRPGDLPPHPESESFSWWMDQGHEAGINPLTGKRLKTISASSINRPAWIIEAVHSVPPTDNGATGLQMWYRILARGSGLTDTAVSVVESTVTRFWPVIDSNEPPSLGASGPCPESVKECGRLSWRELR